MAKIRWSLTVLVAAVVVSAAASSSAQALHWHAIRCLDRPNKDGHSQRRNGNGECEGTLVFAAHLYEVVDNIVAQGSPLNVTSSGGAQTLSATVAGVGVKILCGTLTNSGSVENPTGGGAGKGLATILYLGCTVDPSTLGCSLPEKMASASTSLELEGTESAPVVKFTPRSGTALAEVTFEGCESPSLDGNYLVTGSVLGKLDNETSTLLFKEVKGSASMLKFAGKEAGLEGEDKVLIEGGGTVAAGE